MDKKLAEGVKYTLIKDTISGTKVEYLRKIYDKDRYNARILYFNSGKDSFKYTQYCLFERLDGSFEFCAFNITVGISISNIRFTRRTKSFSLTYTKGKFYVLGFGKRKSVKPLTYKGLESFIYANEGYFDTTKEKSSFTFNYLMEKFSWIKIIHEHRNLCGHMNFNVVKPKKLYSYKSMVRHIFGVPYNIGEILIQSKTKTFSNNMTLKSSSSEGEITQLIYDWKNIKKVLDGVQNLKLEMIQDSNFTDTCRMANVLGRKVNCNWGLNRLKVVHDDWAHEITYKLLDMEETTDLNIRPWYRAFAEHSGFKLLVTNKEMLLEGINQKHCVGTYINDVNSGICAIFHVDGFTLQLVVEETIVDTVNEDGSQLRTKLRKLKNAQFRGFGNCVPPKEVLERVEKALNSFNEVLAVIQEEDKNYFNVITVNKNIVNALPF